MNNIEQKCNRFFILDFYRQIIRQQAVSRKIDTVSINHNELLMDEYQASGWEVFNGKIGIFNLYSNRFWTINFEDQNSSKFQLN